MRKFFNLNNIATWIVLTFVVWLYCFWVFLADRLTLISDALSYYDHTKFYVEHLAQGIFALWDPYWFPGASNDFFLRRIGAYNPLYVLMALLVKTGLSFHLIYLWSLAAYYWLGTIGFYFLAKRIYQDRLVAFLGYLLLLFSSVGTRVFDSYLILVTVPLMWFFYFLVSFVQKPNKSAFLGVILCTSVLLTTYIPFYFITIAGIVVVCFILLYWQHLKVILIRCKQFSLQHKALILSGLFLLALALLSSALFFHQSSHERIVLPERHGQSTVTNIFGVDKLKWGVLEDLFYSGYFSDLRKLQFAIAYVPGFALIILGLGLFNRLRRRLVLLFLVGFVLLNVTSPLSPIYQFCNQHIFYFKYFRNLHFFLWFVLIPLFVLFVIEHFQAILKGEYLLGQRGRLKFFYIHAVHALALIYLFVQSDALWSSYATVLLSYAFFLAFLSGVLKKPWQIFGAMVLCVLPQPIEAYSHLVQNVPQFKSFYQYDALPPKSYAYRYAEHVDVPAVVNPFAKKPPLYYGSFWYNDVYQNMAAYPLNYYLNHSLRLYNHAVVIAENEMDFARLSKIFIDDQDLAFVSEGGGLESFLGAGEVGDKVLKIESYLPLVEVLKREPNQLIVRTRLTTDKFMVYNDSFDAFWQAKIDGVSTKVYRANVAFKGVHVPAGVHTVTFTYGLWWMYVLHIGLLIGFMLALVATIGFSLL